LFHTNNLSQKSPCPISNTFGCNFVQHRAERNWTIFVMTTVCKCIYVSMYVYSIPARTGVRGPPRPEAACTYVRYGVLRRDHSEHGRPRLMMAMILVGCVCTSWFACIVLFFVPFDFLDFSALSHRTGFKASPRQVQKNVQFNSFSRYMSRRDENRQHRSRVRSTSAWREKPKFWRRCTAKVGVTSLFDYPLH
jgi:hypothetical protein